MKSEPENVVAMAEDDNKFLAPSTDDFGGVTQPQIRVPGASAKTYEGRRLFNSFLRHLVKAKCGLGLFARSSLGLARQNEVPTEPPAKAFPMPLPYPEAMASKWRAAPAEVSRKKMMNCIICCLNYLHLGRPVRCPDACVVGRPLSKSQWSIVRRLERFLAAWISCEEVGPSSMGRTAPKIESLETTLHMLSQQASQIASSHLDQYFRQPEEHVSAGASRRDAGVVVGVAQV